MSTGNFHKLIVWQKSMGLAEQIYRTTCAFPVQERFGLISQLRRAAVSIPSNIAEGNMRDSDRDFLRFINIAMGSLAEIETQTELSARLAYLDNKDYEDISSKILELARMLRGMQKRLKQTIN